MQFIGVVSLMKKWGEIVNGVKVGAIYLDFFESAHLQFHYMILGDTNSFGG